MSLAAGFANLWSHGWELVAEILALASVVLIWLPAKRMLNALKGHTIAQEVRRGSGSISMKAVYKRREFLRAFHRWTPLDTSQLMWGLFLAIISSIIKIVLMASEAAK